MKQTKYSTMSQNQNLWQSYNIMTLNKHLKMFQNLNNWE